MNNMLAKIQEIQHWNTNIEVNTSNACHTYQMAIVGKFDIDSMIESVQSNPDVLVNAVIELLQTKKLNLNVLAMKADEKMNKQFNKNIE